MAWFERSCEGQGVEFVLAELLKEGYLSEEHPAVLFHDLDKFGSRVRELREAFPPSTLHTLAIKSNPVLEILKVAVHEGMGLEAASAGELALAIQAGAATEDIVFDSPAKTRSELTSAASKGFVINANSRLEVQRVRELGLKPRLGLRCNPVSVDSRRASTTMVATKGSKFGVPLTEAESVLSDYPEISGLHVHVGSQVATLDDLVEAVCRVLELAKRHPQVSWLDIGGGLPTRYRESDPGLHPRDYWRSLCQRAPELRDFSLITEIGRALQANCGWAASRVEYASHGRAIVHLGADFALRECYQSQDWWHEIQVFDSAGNRKAGPLQEVDIFGPLCFSGDRLAKKRPLPEVCEGDVVVFHDCGAYTLGMWSRYCSRLMPELLGKVDGELQILRKRERPEALVEFWARETQNSR